MRHEVIFQIWAENKWLDYCRETSPHKDLNPTNRWATAKCNDLYKQHGKPFRFYVELWN